MIVWGLVLLGSCIYISLIFNNNLWLDEAFSAALIRTDMAGVLKASANDTLPPLYNILNKLMTMLFGYHSYVMKFNSVLPMILTMVLGPTLIRKHFGFRTAVIFLLCMWGMPYLLYYGVEIRMYSWGLFFVTASGVWAYDYYQTRRKLSAACFILFSLGAGYTHHFAFVSVGMVYLFLLIALFVTERKRCKEWLVLLAITILAYLPCFFTTLQQMKKVNGYFSMPEITPAFLLKCLRYPFVTEFTPLSIALLLVFFAVPVFVLGKERRPSILFPGLWGILCFYGTLTFGAAVSLLFSGNIFSDRYLVPSLGLFWLGFAVFAGHLSKKYTVIILLILLLTTGKTYSAQFQAEYKPGVEDMIIFVNANMGPEDSYLIYEEDYQIEICFRYYFPDFHKTDWDSASKSRGTLWYLSVPGQESHLEEIAAHGYKAENRGSFSFDRYTFELFKLQKTN